MSFMRNMILSVVLMLVLFSSVFAQKHIRGAFTIGTNFAQVDGDRKYGFYKLGLHLGPQAIVEFTDHVYFSIETLYSQMGAYAGKEYNHQTDSILFNGAYKLNLDYVKIPVLLHIVDKRRVGAAVGFSYGRLVNVKEWEHEKRVASTSLNSGVYKKNDWDIIGEIRMRLYKKWWIALRYSYSLIKIRTRDFYTVNGVYSGTRDQYNNSLALRFTYIFNDELPFIKKKKKK